MIVNSWWHGDDPVPVADPLYGQPAPQKRFGPHSLVPLKIEDHYIESYIATGAGIFDPQNMWAAQECQESYGRTPDYILGDCRIHVFPRSETRKALVVEGTKPYILMDVVHDLRILSFDDLTLGKWPGGFAQDIRYAHIQMIRDFYGVDHEWIGHSKGGATAAGLAATFVAIGRSPAALTMFGCPPCCGGKTQKLLAS